MFGLLLLFKTLLTCYFKLLTCILSTLSMLYNAFADFVNHFYLAIFRSTVGLSNKIKLIVLIIYTYLQLIKKNLLHINLSYYCKFNTYCVGYIILCELINIFAIHMLDNNNTCLLTLIIFHQQAILYIGVVFLLRGIIAILFGSANIATHRDRNYYQGDQDSVLVFMVELIIVQFYNC